MNHQSGWCLLAACIVLLASFEAAADTRMLRFPDLHDNRVVFSYGGDLWAAPADGGTATRLTSHSGLELFGKFSPDGESIAFTGQYSGDEQVYIMPAIGGEPSQLTWYPAAGPLPPRWGYDHQVYGWTPDGGAVLFRSRRDAWSSSTATLYTVSASGGLPEALSVPVAGAGTFSDDGRRLFYSPLFRDFRTWKRYQGGWAQDLWLFDLQAGSARALTEHPRTDRDPMWIDGQGYFVSDRDGTLNLYRVDPDSGAIERLTFHEDWDVRWASAGSAGRIVYELNGGLRIFDTGSGLDRAIEITVPDDGVNRRARTVDVSDQIRGAHLSPTGQRVLFEARGNLFNAPVDEGITRALTERSSAHDREADWSPAGDEVVFVSDAGGEEAIYTVAADGSSGPEVLVDGHQARFYRPLYSPTGEHIAVSDHLGRIFIVRADGDGGLREVGRDTGWRNRDYAWSPAGDLLAFSQTLDSDLRALFIHDVEAERTRQVSEGLFSEYEPSFSFDGQFLFFLGERDFAPQMSGREWNFAVNRSTGIFGFALNPDVDHPLAPRDAEETGLDGPSKGGEDEDDEGDASADGRPESTEIEFDGLSQRVFRIPVDSSNYSSLTAVKGGVVFVETDAFYYGRGPERPPRMKMYSFEDRETVDFPDGFRLGDISADGLRALGRRSGDWQVLDLAGKGSESEPVPTGGLRARVDPTAEWATIFDEVWRRFRDHFYVDNMHGYDWEALREQYRPWLQHVAHRSDLNYLMGEMIAELNVSHAYVSGGDQGLPDRHPVALLGARFEIDGDRYRIADVLPGQNEESRYRSPLTEVGMDISAGDYLIAINGRELTAADNVYQRLRLPPGEAVALTISEGSDGSDAREVMVEPIDDETPLHYLAWVLDNHEQVQEASDGRVGYLHVPDMGANGIREFIKWFYGQHHKQGLIIDVRSNGGGNVSQMLIERLSRRPLSLGYSRTQPRATTYPYQAVNAHMVTLLDENSASDGDIFPWQFRNAGLGPLIGKQSWGGVVGITNHGAVIDGGSVNVPEFGFANLDGEYVIEGEGVRPDIEVDNDPASVLAGRDRQLERAIAEVLEKIESDPRTLPERADDPVKTD